MAGAAPAPKATGGGALAWLAAVVAAMHRAFAACCCIVGRRKHPHAAQPVRAAPDTPPACTPLITSAQDTALMATGASIAAVEGAPVTLEVGDVVIDLPAGGSHRPPSGMVASSANAHVAPQRLAGSGTADAEIEVLAKELAAEVLAALDGVPRPASKRPQEAAAQAGKERSVERRLDDSVMPHEASLASVAAPAAASAAAAAAGAAAPSDDEPGTGPKPVRGLAGPFERLVWADEFDYDGLPDPALWEFQTDANKWIHKPSHGELQWYTEGRLENARVQDGRLHITALREPWEGCEFTSARLRTKGRGDWTYGRVEVCAKLTAARRGLWPAIWLVSSDQAYGRWPASGEIDIVENIGCEPGVLHASVHTDAYNHRQRNHRMSTAVRGSAHTAFHVYGLRWTAEGIWVSVDGEDYFHHPNEHLTHREWPFDKRFHLILNVAVGGNWGGKEGVADDVCPATMEVKWVRVFQ